MQPSAVTKQMLIEISLPNFLRIATVSSSLSSDQVSFSEKCFLTTEKGHKHYCLWHSWRNRRWNVDWLKLRSKKLRRILRNCSFRSAKRHSMSSSQ